MTAGFHASLRPLPRLRFALRRACLRLSTAICRRNATSHLGLLGEAAAEAHLTSRGYRVLARRARVPMGEADLLCLAPGTVSAGPIASNAPRPIVIVEVKTREMPDTPATAHQPPEAAVDHAKRAKLRSIAAHLVRANHWHERTVRIDIVAVETRCGRVLTVRHYEGIG